MPKHRPPIDKPLGPSPAPMTLEHEQRLHDFAEAGSDWFWEMDASLRFSYMSDHIGSPLAPFTQGFLGRRVDELDWPGINKADLQALLHQLEIRAPFRDFRIIRYTRSGMRHLAVSGVPVFDAAGGFCGYRGVGRNLSKEILAEERAAIAQSRLVDAIECISESFLLLDAENRLVLCNSRYRELYAPIADLLVPGTKFEDICRAGAKAGLVVRARPSEPNTDAFEIAGRWFQSSERRTQEGGTVVVQTEITALKRREQELAEKTALLRATLDNMEHGLLVLDASLTVRMWNDRAADLLELPPDTLETGCPMERIVRVAALRGDYGRGDTDTLVVQRLDELCRPENQIFEVFRPNGRVLEIRRSAMPNGGMLMTYADITDRKRVEADLRRAKEEAELASRSKTEFLANMSHELRTPLNAVIGFSDILSGQFFGPLGDPRYNSYARDIRDSGLHLLTLINDVLDVAKVEFGKVELIEEPIDMSVIVQSCARLMHERAETAGVALIHQLPAELPYVRGDGRRLKQILLNLLSNAVKFTPSGGRVSITAAHDAEGFRLIIEDTGIGIAAGDLETALRPFGQIDSRLARKYQGTGLGLPLARSMAELHGGRLELDSTPGAGTIATLWLPPSRILPSPSTNHP